MQGDVQVGLLHFSSTLLKPSNSAFILGIFQSATLQLQRDIRRENFILQSQQEEDIRIPAATIMTSKSLPSVMRSWQYNSTSGGLENNLKLNSSAPLPTPKNDQHLVRILATALNPVDVKPAENAIISRLLITKPATPGIDFVGRIVKPAAGSSLKPNQLVFGFGAVSPFAGGCLREYTAAPTIGAIALPKSVNPIDAATIGKYLLGITSSKAFADYSN